MSDLLLGFVAAVLEDLLVYELVLIGHRLHLLIQMHFLGPFFTAHVGSAEVSEHFILKIMIRVLLISNLLLQILIVSFSYAS